MIKHIPLQGFEEHEVVEALNEVHALRLLQHPNIVRLHDSWASEGVRQWLTTGEEDTSYLKPSAEPWEGIPKSLNILMEYADGGTLDKLLSRNSDPLDELLVSMWFAQMVLAVAHMHEKGVLHRDLKARALVISCI